MLSVVVTIILVLLVCDLIFRLVAVRVAVPVFENRPPFGPETFSPDPQIDSFNFPSGSNLQLRGCLFRNPSGPARGLVLFCPEYGSDRWSARHYCSGLLQAGFDVLTFDFRNQGDSDHLPGYRPLHWTTEFEVEDVRAAIQYARSRTDLKSLPLALFGVSRGGVAALVTAAREPGIKCVASDGAYSAFNMIQHYIQRWGNLLYLPKILHNRVPQWHIDLTIQMVLKLSQWRKSCRYVNLEESLSLLRCPVLLISGERDTYVVPELTHKLHAMTGQTSDAVWIIPKAKHNKGRQIATAAYDNRLQKFFALLGPAHPTAKIVSVPPGTASSSQIEDPASPGRHTGKPHLPLPSSVAEPPLAPLPAAAPASDYSA